MGSKLDVKKWLLASLAVLVGISILEFIMQRALMIQTFPELFPQPAVARDVTLLRFYTYLGRALFSLAFVYIFIKGLEGKSGLLEGVRFGLWIGVLTAIPGFLGTLVTTDFSFGALFARMVSVFIELVLCGMLANWFFLKKNPA